MFVLLHFVCCLSFVLFSVSFCFDISSKVSIFCSFSFLLLFGILCLMAFNLHLIYMYNCTNREEWILLLAVVVSMVTDNISHRLQN